MLSKNYQGKYSMELIAIFLTAVIFFASLNYIAFKKKVSRKLSGVIIGVFISVLLLIIIATFFSPHSTGDDFAAGLLITFVVAILLLAPFLLPVFAFSLIKDKILFVVTLVPGSVVLYFIIRAILIGAF